VLFRSQVGDLHGWANEVGQLYGVNSIPHSILLDKDGVIIAKNLRGEELHEKLEEVLISE
jgi:predicted regulator of Ras-like GTPase activity (Roadblock/LC7/MglB family)